MKTFIKNRKNQKIAVFVQNANKQHKLAFVEHGLGGNKDSGIILAMVRGFLDQNFTVVSFDTTNSFGESGGDYRDASITNSYEDLEDVIEWAKQQEWFRDQYVLCGHSLGGISVGLYAENYPERVAALVPVASVVSGELSAELAKSYEGEENLDHWRQTGVRITYSSDGSVKKILPWSHMEDRLKYDLLPHANKLTMPVLIIVGTNDDRTPSSQQQILFDALPEPKKLIIIDGAEHGFYKDGEREQLSAGISNWLSVI